MAKMRGVAEKVISLKLYENENDEDVVVQSEEAQEKKIA